MLPDETLIRSGRAVHLRSTADGRAFDSIEGRLFLTSARLWFEPSPISGDALRTAYEANGALKSLSLPLKHATRVSQRKVMRRPALKIEFDNSGRAYFHVKAAEPWTQGVRAAMPNAPELPLTLPPATKHGVDYKGHLIAAALKTMVTLAVIAAVAYYFAPIWMPYAPALQAKISAWLAALRG
jgi:hypothetical protein